MLIKNLKIDDLSVHKYREDFERVMRSNAKEWGFDPEEKLDYWHLTINEELERPLRGDFKGYVEQSTSQFFSIFCAGAKSEKLRQEEKKAKKKLKKKAEKKAENKEQENFSQHRHVQEAE